MSIFVRHKIYFKSLHTVEALPPGRDPQTWWRQLLLVTHHMKWRKHGAPLLSPKCKGSRGGGRYDDVEEVGHIVLMAAMRENYTPRITAFSGLKRHLLLNI